jgi:hypothetical protein
MRKTLFVFSIIFLISAASAFAQATNSLLLKPNAPQKAQAAANTDSKVVRGNPTPSLRPTIGKAGATVGKSPAPGLRPENGKGQKTSGSPLQLQVKHAPRPVDNARTGAVKMHHLTRAPSNMDAGDPLTKLYQAHTLLNQLFAAEPDDSRKAAYKDAKKLVGKAIKIINASRGVTG